MLRSSAISSTTSSSKTSNQTSRKAGPTASPTQPGHSASGFSEGRVRPTLASGTRASASETLENELSADILGSLNVSRYSVLVGSRQGVLLIPLAMSGPVAPSLLVAPSLPSLDLASPRWPESAPTIGQASIFEPPRSPLITNAAVTGTVTGTANGMMSPVHPSNFVAKSVPVLQIPPAPQRFLGRQRAIEQAITAIQSGRSVEIVGPPGVGKSAFLRYLAHRPELMAAHPDGILYLNRSQPVADLVQVIGETFYLIYPDGKLTVPEWQQLLQALKVLVILADSQWLTADIQVLRRIMPHATFLMVSATPRSLENVQSLTLSGLSFATAGQLATQILGRDLNVAEQAWLQRCWQQFQGQPAPLVQVLELVHQGRLSWAQCEQSLWAAHIAPIDAPRCLIQQALAVLSTPQRWILGLLSAMDGVGLTAPQIASMTGPQEPQSCLQGLVRLALVQHLEGRYRLPEQVRSSLAQQFDSQPWMERGATVLARWLSQQPPEMILPEVPVAMVFVRWAVQQKRWALVLELARSLDSTLAIAKQWEEWRRVLQWALQAAWQLEDTGAEAWAWHQLGVRALCLEDVTTAYDALDQALRLRQGLGDPQAIALTARMLHYSRQGILPARLPVDALDRLPRWRTYALLGVISLVTFLATVGLVLGVRQGLQSSPSDIPGHDRPVP